MDQASIIGIDLAKHSFQVHGARADGSVAFRKKSEPRESARFSRLSAALRGGNGGLRERSPLGPRGREARARSQVGSADIREAIRQASEERYGRRGGDLPEAAQRPTMSFVAVKTEEQQARGAVPYARSSGTPADANDQRAAGPFGGVWRDRTTGACSCQPLGLGARGSVLGATGCRSASWPTSLLLEQIAGLDGRYADWRRMCTPAPARRRGGAPHDDTGGPRANHCDGACRLRTADGELSARARLLRMAGLVPRQHDVRRQAQAGQDIQDAASATSGGF